MPGCELCGKTGGTLLAEVEGVEMQVCPVCAKYGMVKKRGSEQAGVPRRSLVSIAPEFRVVESYAGMLRQARNSRGMNQQEFARFLNERESVVAKWEQGTLTPDVEVARKLEKRLGILLVEKEETPLAMGNVSPGNKEEFTLGDFVKVRKRK